MGCFCSTEAGESARLVDSSSKSFNAAKSVFENPSNTSAAPNKTNFPTKSKPPAAVTNSKPPTKVNSQSTSKKTENVVYQAPTQTAGQKKPKYFSQTAHTSSRPQTPSQNNAKPNFTRAQSKTGALLQWCKENTKECSLVEITNFTSSWQDGIAFMALLHHFRPDLINMRQVSSSPVKNLHLAFTAASKAGIAQLLEPDEIAEYPERLSIITYITLFHSQFA